MEAQGASKQPSTMSWRVTEEGEPAGPACSHAWCAPGRTRTCAPGSGGRCSNPLSYGGLVPLTSGNSIERKAWRASLLFNAASRRERLAARNLIEVAAAQTVRSMEVEEPGKPHRRRGRVDRLASALMS